MLQLETIDDAYSFHSYDEHSAKLIKPNKDIHSMQSKEDALREISCTTLIYKNQLETRDYPQSFTQFDHNCIEKLLQHDADIYLIGTGQQVCFPEKAILQHISEKKLSIDFMDIGAACRTFNILTGEYRKVAALIFFK